MRKHPRTVAIAAATIGALAVATLASTASAAGMGKLHSRGLTATSFRSGVFLDTFTGPAGTTVGSQPGPCGPSWAVRGGSLALTDTGRAVANGSALVTATLPQCTATATRDVEVGADVRSFAATSAGLLIQADRGGRPATALIYSNGAGGTMELDRVDSGGKRTVLAKVTGVGNGNGTRYLHLVYVAGRYTARIDGATALTYTAAAADRPSLEAYTETGLVSVADSRSEFDHFQSYPR